MKNYVQPGKVVPLIAPAALSSGDALLVGDIFGVVASDAVLGASVETRLEGVFDLPKAAEDITQGMSLYWDDSAKNLTVTATGNTLVAKAIEAAGTGASTVRVRLNG